MKKEGRWNKLLSLEITDYGFKHLIGMLGWDCKKKLILLLYLHMLNFFYMSINAFV